MIPNIEKILKEWSYRVGVIKPNNSKHLHHLNNILTEEGWPYTVINEITKKLMNEIDGCAVVRASLATLECMLRRHCTTDRFSLWILGAPRSQS